MSSKEKGGLFERRVCRDLSLWISAGTDGDLFWRSASSGGRATVRGGDTLAHAAGDVAAVKPGGFPLTTKFFVECKHYKTLQLHLYMVHKPNVLGKFFDVARIAAAKYHRSPLLIAKQNRLPALIMMSPKSWRDFKMTKCWYMTDNRAVIGLFTDFIANADTSFLL